MFVAGKLDGGRAGEKKEVLGTAEDLEGEHVTRCDYALRRRARRPTPTRPMPRSASDAGSGA